MSEIIKDLQSVYEIGYLIASNVPEENVQSENDKVCKIVTDAGGNVLREESAKREQLAYTIRKKTTAGSYDKHDFAYFGWIKFEVGSDKIENIKKNVELMPSILRVLVITTVRENTYIGKRAAASMTLATEEVKKAAIDQHSPEIVPNTVVAPPSIEEMDKSIDEMVKEV